MSYEGLQRAPPTHCQLEVSAAHGRVLIIQQEMPPPGSTTSRDLLFEGAMSDLNMLVFSRGYERTEAEYGALLAAAGFTLTNVVPTASLMSIVEVHACNA
jgi:hypothetical protein